MRACINLCTSQGEPREANNGYLCSGCYSDLRKALQDLPAALEHLREVYVLRRPIELDATKPQKKDPPAPFNLDAFQLAEDLWIALTGGYIPTTWNHLKVYAEAQDRCQDIHQHLDAVVNEKSVVYLLPVIKLLRTALYRYPLEEKSRATLLPCPNCNQKTVYSPPGHYGADLEIKCHVCEFKIPPEKMEFYAHLAERARDANV